MFNKKKNNIIIFGTHENELGFFIEKAVSDNERLNWRKNEYMTNIYYNKDGKSYFAKGIDEYQGLSTYKALEELLKQL